MFKHLKIILATFTLCSLIIVYSSCENTAKTTNDVMPIKEKESIAQENLLRHVVLFNFTESATDEIVKKIEQEFAALPKEISEINSFEWGINNSPEGLDKGLTHCFLVTFLSEKDRAIYLPHPAHQKFVKLIGPYVEDVTVVDYWTK